MAELPIDEKFKIARARIDDVLRTSVSEIGPRHLDEDDEPLEAVENPILADWMLLTDWIDQEGEHHYVRVASEGLAPHARYGLLRMFEE